MTHYNDLMERRFDMGKWSEIKTEHMDTEDLFIRVDAWETDSADEEGQVIAYIDTLTGRVIYNDPVARFDAYAQEVVSQKVDEIKKIHPYDIRVLENVCRSMVNYELGEPELKQAFENLSSMGFSNEQIFFFGFPQIEL